MFSILTGSLLLSVLHAVIPNHWLPVLAIGRREAWTIGEITKVTFIAAVAHAASTILIGFILGFLGAELSIHIERFTQIISPALLVVLGIFFVYRHHRHKHFHVNNDVKKKASKNKMIIILVVAMFFSPCMEIEAYFLLAGAKAIWLLWAIAIVYFFITTTGMLLLVRYAYKGILKLNWHSLEHSAGIITGITLIVTGILTFFIH